MCFVAFPLGHRIHKAPAGDGTVDDGIERRHDTHLITGRFLGACGNDQIQGVDNVFAVTVPGAIHDGQAITHGDKGIDELILTFTDEIIMKHIHEKDD